ncbi:carbohydrate-binding module family 13 protein [Rhizophagus irregularis DAOM 181602=DAOM 197198]|nr:carbohydrate-binding module family 13 protein [Rhizophagus irregularis DAOM 181602=DAOM 197198]
MLINIKLPNISPEIFQIILWYIYGGKISLEEYDILDIVKIMVAANELNLQELIPYLESFLIENKANWMDQNFNLIYHISFENDSFPKLQKHCKDLISKEPNKIFNLPNFSTIPEKLLITLIQNDNLRMGEIQIWEYVIKWGLAQNPELPSDLTSFSKDDFNTLKNTLQQCIPFIRFHNLASKEFLKKVLPYKKILPKELYKGLLEYFLDNDSKKAVLRISKEYKEIHIDSKIITFQHVELISKWIDRLEIADRLQNSYEFKLLYRDSRDGSSELISRFDKLRMICKNQSRTVIVSKVKGNNEILGGYNPIEWKFDNSYGITKDSFIFSFSNDSIENYTLSRVKNEEKAIYNGTCSTGLAFDVDLELYRDLINELRIGCNKSSYKKKIGEINHSYIEEFEVFQINV